MKDIERESLSAATPFFGLTAFVYTVPMISRHIFVNV